MSLEHAFAERGFVVARAVFGADELDQLSRFTDRVQALPRAWTLRPPFRTYHSSLENPEELLLLRYECFLDEDHELRPLLLGPALLHLVERLLGATPQLFEDRLLPKPRGAIGTGTHQDAVWFAWLPFARRLLTAVVAIDEADVTNGGYEVVPGGHRLGVVGRPGAKDPSLARLRHEPVPLAPGDVLFHDGLLPHRTGSNRSARRRALAVVSFHARRADASRDDSPREHYYRAYPRWLRRQVLKQVLDGGPGR